MEQMALQGLPSYTRMRIQAASLTVAAIFLCFGLFVHNALRQRHLDQQLVRSVHEGNIKAETMLLEQGADANTPGELTPPPSSLREWVCFLRHTPSASESSLLSGTLCAKSLYWTRGIEDKTSEQRWFIALERAENQECEKIVTLLIEHGADVNAKGSSGMSPLMLACMGDCSDTLARLLLDKGANINAVARDGTNAFYYAVQHCPLRTVELLIKSGANVNVRDTNTGSTALLAFFDTGSAGLCGTGEGWHTVAQIMLAHGVNPNTPDSRGTTPLSCAIFADDSFYTDLLLKYGADPNKADNEGRTPLLALSYLNSPSDLNVHAIEALLTAGANADDRSQTGGGQVYEWLRHLKRGRLTHSTTRQPAEPQFAKHTE